MPSWAKAALDGWAGAAGISSGPVLRRVSMPGSSEFKCETCA